MRVRWSAQSRDDLPAIGRFIAADDPRAARRWVALLQNRARRAAATPRAGRRVPEHMREDVREILQDTYRIVYRIRKSSIEVLTVFDGRRLLRAGPPSRIE